MAENPTAVPKGLAVAAIFPMVAAVNNGSLAT
jgi:hypothetical protein